MIIDIQGDTPEAYAASMGEAMRATRGLKTLSQDLQSDDWFFENEDGEIVQVVWGPGPQEGVSLDVALSLALRQMTE